MRKLELLWGMPVFVKEEGAELRAFGTFLENESPLVHSQKISGMLMEKADKQQAPVVYKDDHRVYFLCIKSKNRYYLSGPVCVEVLNYVEIHRYYKQYGISSDNEKHPVRMSLTKLLNFVSFLYELLEKKNIDLDTLMLENDLVKDQRQDEEKEKIRMEMEKIDEEIYHHTYLEERYVMDCIREGKADEALERLGALLENAGTLSRNKFNDQKYMAVVSVTMATREAIAGGVSPAEAYRLSDLLINEVDRCKKIDQITEVMRLAVFRFANMVSECRKNRNSSNYTEQCKDYISQNYHHKIYLDETAEAIGISQGHLSRVFRHDTGMQIQEYIQKFRVERAANLLKYSEASLTEISDYVCFHSQSHFGSVFKKYMNMTPGEYRNLYKQKEFISD